MGRSAHCREGLGLTHINSEMYGREFRGTWLKIPKWMSEILSSDFQLLVCFGLLHQFSVIEFSDTFCHSVYYESALLIWVSLIEPRCVCVQPDVFLGPVCPYVLAPVARYSATGWNIPVISTGGMEIAFRLTSFVSWSKKKYQSYRIFRVTKNWM